MQVYGVRGFLSPFLIGGTHAGKLQYIHTALPMRSSWRAHGDRSTVATEKCARNGVAEEPEQDVARSPSTVVGVRLSLKE